MHTKKKIVVLGSGGWGTALGISAHSCGHDVTLWSAFPAEIEEIARTGRNKLLEGIEIPSDIALTSDNECMRDAEICILAVPSFACASVCETAAQYLSPDAVIVNIGKGFDPATQARLSVTIGQKLPGHHIVVLSGPSHAEEVARAVPTALVAACRDEETANMVQDTLASPSLRIYTNSDVTGVELGGALKNVIALACGIACGMGYGDNTMAALMTRGLREIGELGVAMGAMKETFAGLSGLGDLIVTCTSMLSRNRRAGQLIGEGVTVEDALARIGTVEGYHAAKIVYDIAEKYGVSMPIHRSCYKICYCGADVASELEALMTRPLKREHDETWLT